MTTSLKIEFERSPQGSTRFMTEAEFRQALTATLAQAHAFAGESAAALGAAAEYIDKLPSDCSWLGTFTTIAEQSYTEGRVPDGLECPVCHEDQMDHIAPNDAGEMACDCGTIYSGDTQYGRPSWYNRKGTVFYFVPTYGTTGRYVTIPSD